MSDFLKETYNQRVFNKLVKDLFPEGSVGRPVAVIYGAQPGAGKSAIKPYLSSEYPDIAILDGDELRKFHPDYKSIVSSDPENMPALTQQFVYDILDELKRYAQENKKSYALETTFHNGNVTRLTFQEAQKRGFQTELHILAVNPKISYLSTLQRFEVGNAHGSIGRKVTKEDHFDRASKNIEALRYCHQNKVADKLVLYRREILNGVPRVSLWKVNPESPVDDFLSERSRPLTSTEQQTYKNMAIGIVKAMEARNALPEQIDTFKMEFSQFFNHQPE